MTSSPIVGLFATLALVALAACASPKGSFCAIATPLRPSAETLAVMSDAEVTAMLQHNETGRRLCGWRQ